MTPAHPQWRRVLHLVRAGDVGEVRAIVGAFSYDNRDPANIRNREAMGGGGLMDIGCYLVHVARWIMDREPDRVAAAIERDPSFGTDRLTSMLLDFGSAHAIGTCATQMTPYQRDPSFGTDRLTSMLLDLGSAHAM